MAENELQKENELLKKVIWNFITITDNEYKVSKEVWGIITEYNLQDDFNIFERFYCDYGGEGGTIIRDRQNENRSVFEFGSSNSEDLCNLLNRLSKPYPYNLKSPSQNPCENSKMW